MSESTGMTALGSLDSDWDWPPPRNACCPFFLYDEYDSGPPLTVRAYFNLRPEYGEGPAWRDIDGPSVYYDLYIDGTPTRYYITMTTGDSGVIYGAWHEIPGGSSYNWSIYIWPTQTCLGD